MTRTVNGTGHNTVANLCALDHSRARAKPVKVNLTLIQQNRFRVRAATFAGSYQDADDDDVAPLPKRRKIAVGDRVSLTLDPLEGVVTKTGSGWYTVKFEFGGVDNFRADELLVL